MYEYLTRQGNYLEQLIPIELPILPDKRYNYLRVRPEPPIGSLLHAHPTTSAIANNIDSRCELNVDLSSDMRFRFEIHPNHDLLRRRRQFMLQLAERTFIDMDLLWREFLDLTNKWGTVGSQMWDLGRVKEMDRQWNLLDDDAQIYAENAISNHLGIADEYPRRVSRRRIFFTQMEFWLCAEYTERILSSAALSRQVADTTDCLLQIKFCSICGRPYQEIQLDPYLVDRFPYPGDCCLACPMQHPSKSNRPHLVKSLVESFGFVPRVDMNFESLALHRRLGIERFHSAAASLTDLGYPLATKMTTQDWMREIIASGAVGDGVWITKRGYRCVAKDGHICLSLDELAIDNWMHDHGIEHEKEPMYPHHAEFNPNGRMRADWKAGDYYVEYFGLAGEPAYDEKIARKMNLARILEVPLLAIYPEDMRNLDRSLQQMLL